MKDSIRAFLLGSLTAAILGIVTSACSICTASPMDVPFQAANFTQSSSSTASTDTNYTFTVAPDLRTARETYTRGGKAYVVDYEIVSP